HFGDGAWDACLRRAEHRVEPERIWRVSPRKILDSDDRRGLVRRLSQEFESRVSPQRASEITWLIHPAGKVCQLRPVDLDDHYADHRHEQTIGLHAEER